MQALVIDFEAVNEPSTSYTPQCDTYNSNWVLIHHKEAQFNSERNGAINFTGNEHDARMAMMPIVVCERRVHCMICDLEIDDVQAIPGNESLHLPTCSIGKEFKCEVCSEEFNKAVNLRVHTCVVHEAESQGTSEDGKFHCCICNRGFMRRKALLGHLQTHYVSDLFCCTKCRALFHYKLELTRHLRWSPCSTQLSNDYDKLVFCPECSTTISFDQMALHKRQHVLLKRMSKKSSFAIPLPTDVLNGRSHVCEVCEKRFKRPAELKRHLATHSGIRAFRCDQCDRSYAHERGLLTHVERDHEMRRYACPICRAPFKSIQSMERHAQAVHRIGQSEAAHYACPQCTCKFNNIGALSVHLKHQHESVLPDHMRRAYVCPFCEKMFVKNRDCLAHIRSHTMEKQNRCKRCGKKFLSRNGLKTHMEIHLRQDMVDPTLAMHRCTDCFKLLSSADALRRHKAIHQLYQCRRCGARLPSSVRLRHHEAACPAEGENTSSGSLMQLGETASQRHDSPVRTSTSRPASVAGLPVHGRAQQPCMYSCRICSLTFPNFSTWRVHTRAHSGRPLRSHICWLCHKAFSSFQQLTRHKQVHERERPMNCVVCQRSFRNRNRWLVHMAECHPDVRTTETLPHDRTGAASAQHHQHPPTQGDAQPTRAQSANMFAPQGDYYNDLLAGPADGMYMINALDFGHNVPAPDLSMGFEPGPPVHQMPAYVMPAQPVPEPPLPVPSTTSAATSLTPRCPVCSHLYDTMAHLVQHCEQLTAEPAHMLAVYECLVCGGKLKGSATFIEHMREEHQVTYDAEDTQHLPAPLARKARRVSEPAKTQLSCPICQKTFARRYDVDRHMKSHTGEKAFGCGRCGQRFSTSYHYNDHLSRHGEEDNGARAFACTLCAKTYAAASSLKTHMRKHTGERPHKCRQCEADFMTSGDLSRHLKWHAAGCPKKRTVLKLPELAASTAEGDSRTREQLAMTVRQISSLKKRPLEVHTSSAFSAPLGDAATRQQPTLCLMISTSPEGYFVEISAAHSQDRPQAFHVCLAQQQLQNSPDPLEYRLEHVVVAISVSNALQALHLGEFPQAFWCPVNQAQDVAAAGRVVWMRIAVEQQQQPQQPAPFVAVEEPRFCALCEVSFATPAQSRAHFASEDHETAMLTSGPRRWATGPGPSLSVNLGIAEPVNAAPRYPALETKNRSTAPLHRYK